jgi:hypothetical protein
MKKIKIVWYWNSRLRCFDQNGKIAAAHPREGKFLVMIQQRLLEIMLILSVVF